MGTKFDINNLNGIKGEAGTTASNSLKTPCYLVDESLLIKNCKILKHVIEQSNCHILLAQKAFSMFSLYPLIGEYLDGTTASGLFEAKLGKEEMGKETHIFSPAYQEDEFEEISDICDHIIFNSFAQLEKYKQKALEKGKQIGLRINPECSTQDHDMYDPCGSGSRFGVKKKDIKTQCMNGVSGIHFHTLCEQNVDALLTTLKAVEHNFSDMLHQMEWVNFGGGHHITREDYDVECLIKTINDFKQKYKVQVYLEPGEAVVLNAGYLVSTVVELLDNDRNIAILDTSTTCHMPDVLEVPYRPNIIHASIPGEKAHTYRLGGPTCLAGDVIGDYSFDKPLNIGDKLVFCDMAHYTMVKNNTFNGMNLPSIGIIRGDGRVELVKSFGYEDFKGRLS